MELCCSWPPVASVLPRAAKPAFCLSSSNSVLFGNGARSFSRGSVSVFSRRRTPRQAPRRPGECRCLFGLGVPELVVIAGVAALVFGPKKLPEIGKSIGKTVKGFQEAAKEFETELKKEEPEAEAASSVEKPNAVGGENGEKKLETTPSKEGM